MSKVKSIFLSVFCVLITAFACQYVSAAPNLTPFAGQVTGEAPVPADPLTLWYRTPAREWTSALPVGNGIQGAMVYGGIDNEIICLNEHTLWAGGPYNPDNAKALEFLPQVRQLMFEGKYSEAERMIDANMLANPRGQLPYQPVGDLMLSFPVQAAENYIRELNLSTATAKVQYTADGVTYTREMFASYPDNVMVLVIKADKPGKINFTLGMRTEQVITNADNPGTDDTLILSGTNRDNSGVKAALKFQSRIKIVNQGGTLTKNIRAAEPAPAPAPAPAPGGFPGRGARGSNAVKSTAEYTVANADSVVVYIATATSFKNFNDVSGDPEAITTGLISKASAKGIEAIRKDQLADYQKIFNRVTMDLGANQDAKLPTDQRILKFKEGNDPALVTLYFQYGRYMLISSSRAGGQPANLQGVWNADTNPAWGSKYTININAEMNYWPVQNTNLAECAAPLMNMVEDLMVTGAKTAKTMYNANGWVAHHNTDLWRATAPIDMAASGMWPCGGAWLCNTIYDSYEYTNDKELLKRLYPAMKGAAQFFLDTLVEEPKTKTLVTSPSLSPEVGHPQRASVCYGPTMDQQLLRDLFAHIIDANKILGLGDDEFVAKIAAARAKLAPNKISAGGVLQEWFEDWDMQSRNQNRHISHMYGLYPGKDISFYTDKALVEACRQSMIMRGDNATGWGLGWRLCVWARLHDGPHAYIIIKNLLNPARPEGANRDSAGVYNNLFDAHPPFQIDGNFGGSAGIAEMLVQSVAPKADQSAVIDLLPALAPQWPVGKVTGLVARGNFCVDVAWDGGKLTEAVIKNQGSAEASVKVLLGDKTVTVKLAPGASAKLDGQLASK